MPKRFTLQEAEALLPQIGAWIREAVSLKSGYEEAEGQFQSLLQHILMTGGVVVDRDHASGLKSARDRSRDRLKSVLESIQETGCVVKDLDVGLVDFPTLFRGEEVYLCWRMDEARIGFWHGTQEGFAGRKPIDDDFLANHKGDKTQ